MAEYIELPLVADATALSDLGKDYMADAIPGWVSRPGSVEGILLEANGQMGAEVVDQAAQVPPLIFSYFGQSLLGIPLQQAVSATTSATFAFDAGAVATVPAGTNVALPSPDGNSYLFTTDADVRSDGALDVGVTALEPGTDPNGATGAGELIDTVDGVASVTVAVAASGGVAEETEDEYLNRLADALTILAPRPILPQDFATLARQVPGVGRTLALNLYQPGTADNAAPLTVEGTPVNTGAGVTPVEKCLTVAVTAEQGAAPTQALMHSVYLLLDASREVNFLVYVIPPTYTTIDVQATVTAYPGYLASEVEAAAEGMLAEWLSPGGFGSETAGEDAGWASDTKARVYEAVDFLNRAAGVHYVETVQLRKAGGSFGGADVNLTGAAPLPTPGALSVTVHTP